MPKQSADLLPDNLPPVLIDRITASAYIGVSPSFFDELVASGRMPRPRQMGDKRKAWLVIVIEDVPGELVRVVGAAAGEAGHPS